MFLLRLLAVSLIIIFIGFWVDVASAIPPQTTITNVVDNDSGSVLIDEDGNGSETIYVYFTVEPGSSAQTSFDNGSWKSASEPRKSFRSTVGSHTVRVRGRNSAGEVDLTPASVTYTVLPKSTLPPPPPPADTDGDGVPDSADACPTVYAQTADGCPVAPPPPPTSGGQPAFPIRAIFYYPWFPNAWSQSGISPFTRYTPSLGLYNSSDPALIRKHLAAMQYAKTEAGISSWWGPGHHTDSAFGIVLSTTAADNSPFRWTLYYEQESQGNPTVAQIQSDLAYISSHYTSSPAYLRVNDKPVIFVYASTDGCEMADRWVQANADKAFYVVLKVFSGYKTCASQPDSWHQYGPATAESIHSPYSFNISPGFWLTSESAPRLVRDLDRFRQGIKDEVASGLPWQLVTSFNEWGENTIVESAVEWASPSGFGDFLDALHADGYSTGGGTPPPADTDGDGVLDSVDACPTVFAQTADGCPVVTPPPPTTSGIPIIAAAGDIACDPTSGSFNNTNGSSSSCHMRAVSDQLLAMPRLDAVLGLGDDQYESGTLTEYQASYEPTWGRLKAKTYPSVGNHQYLTTNATGYYDYWNGTGNQSGRAGDRSKGYYSYDIGAWHIIALNTNCSQAGGCGTNSPQEVWLRNDLINNPKACTLAYMHHPRFSSGTHGSSTGPQPLWQTLYNANADLVLNGHEHLYERFAPQTPQGTSDPVRGIRQFTVGTGGKGLTTFSTTIQPNSEARNDNTFGTLRLTLYDAGYDYQFVPEPGKTFIDAGSGTCH